jgi:predicted transcriptional regulator
MSTRFCLRCKARDLGYNDPKEMFEDLLWKKGMGQEEISKLLGVRQGSVSAMIKRSGSEPRSRGRIKKRRNNCKSAKKGGMKGEIV